MSRQITFLACLMAMASLADAQTTKQIKRDAAPAMLAGQRDAPPAGEHARQANVRGIPVRFGQHSGSLLIWSNVEVKWNASGELVLDTFIEITNDGDFPVSVQFYIVNGDDPLEEISSAFPPFNVIERSHPGWNFLDTELTITQHQSTWLSAATGNNDGASSTAITPFAALDGDSLQPDDPDYSGPGRPDPDGQDRRAVRGFLVAWASSSFGQEVTHNSLTGKATKVDYERATAWEYDAWTFRRLNNAPSDRMLPLDGTEYEAAPARLIFDFFAAGAIIKSTLGSTELVVADTDLTVHPISVDFRQNASPVTTLVQADIWNQNEIRFSGARRCITCWDQTLIGQFDPSAFDGGLFRLENLATNRGTARLTGKGLECDDAVDSPLLGVAARMIRFGDSGIKYSGKLLSIDGVDTSAVIYGR